MDYIMYSLLYDKNYYDTFTESDFNNQILYEL